MSADAVIELRSLTKRYGSTPAVDDLDWSGGRGVIGLLGPNGAGKSTLLRMLATVLGQDSGTIRVFGLDPAVADERLAIRRRLGYLRRKLACTATSRRTTSSTTSPCSRRSPTARLDVTRFGES